MNPSDAVVLIPESEIRLFKQICIWRAVSVTTAIKQTNSEQSPDLFKRLTAEQTVLKNVLAQLTEYV